MDDTPIADKPLLMIVFKRMAILCLIVEAISAFFWAIGSYQDFLDMTQVFLLQIIRFASLGLLFFSLAGLSASLTFTFLKRIDLRIVGIIGYIGLLVLGICGSLFAKIILELGQGLHAG